MEPPPPGDGYDHILPFMQPLTIGVGDHIALTASYDQCLALALALHAPDDVPVRAALMAQSLPRLAVTGLTALGGLVSYLNHPDTSVKSEVRGMLLSASCAGRYPAYPGEAR